MKVNVRGKNKFEPSVAIRDYATNKLQKLDQYFKHSNELEAFVLCKTYDSHKTVEITIPTKNILLRAEVKDDTIYGAVDLAVDKLESQIRKHKSKIYSSYKRREGVSGFYANNSDFDLEKIKTEILATNLVKQKNVELKPMTVEDAVVQMEMLDHSFYVFKNLDTDKICVVYRREDEDYGIIETNN